MTRAPNDLPPPPVEADHMNPPRGWVTSLLLREFSISQGTLILMAAFIFSAALGVLRQVLLNAQFGLSMEADAYNAAARLPETLNNLLTGGNLAVNAIIPVLLGVQHTRGQQAAWRFTNLVTTTLLVFITPAVLLCIAGTPLFVRGILAPGFDDPTSTLAITLTRILLTELLLAVVSGVASAVLISRNQFILPALSIAVRNIALLLGIVASMYIPGLGIYGPTLGAVSDSLLQLAILLPGLFWQGFAYRIVWDLRDPDLRETIRLLIPSGLSGVVNYAGGIVDTAFASLTRSTGDISALHNAFLLIGLPVRLLGIAIGQAAFPRLAAYAVDRDWHTMRRVLLWALGVALALGLLAMVGLVVLGRFGIRVLFERGAFDAAAGDLTYTLVLAYTMALPAAIATEILTRGLVALHDTRTPLFTNGVQLVGRLVLIPLLLPQAGIVAIPLAFVFTSLLETVILAGVLWFKLRRRSAIL